MVSFGFMHLAPIDPARFMLGFRQGPMREEQIRELRAWYGLDYPVPVQYGIWIGRVVRGDFGRSITSRRDIAPELFRRVPWSLLLIATSAALVWVLAIPMAVAAARGGGAGWASDTLATIGLIVPTFLLATLCVYVFAVRLTWIPILPPYELNLLDPSLWEGLLLPSASLALPVAAIVARRMRGDLRAILRAPYVAAALARGLSVRRVVWRHAVRVATRSLLARPLPVVSLLFSGMLVVEEIFNWPGIARVFMRSIVARDIPVIQAVLLVLAALVVAMEFIIRLAWDRFRPRDGAAPPDGDPAAEARRASVIGAPGLRARAAVVVAAALVIAAVAAPVLVRFPPDQVLLEEIHLPPSLRHWLGTDSSGRDMFSRLAYAGRTTLGMAGGAAAAAVCLGVLLTGHVWWGRRWDPSVAWTERIIARLPVAALGTWDTAVAGAAHVVTALPALPLVMALVSVAGRAPVTIGAVFAVLGLASIAAGMRALLAGVRRWAFVEAAEASGAPTKWIGERHLLPHLARPLAAAAAGLVPGFLILEATLGFLGFTVTPTMTTWGTLLWRAREALHRGDWWLLVFPAVFMGAAAWAFGGIGEALAEPQPPTYARVARLGLGKEWGRAATPALGRVSARGPVLARSPVLSPGPGRVPLRGVRPAEEGSSGGASD